MRAKRSIILAGMGLVLWTAAAEAQFSQVTVRTVNIDYYLLNYFSRVNALPRGKDPLGLDYVMLSLFGPTWNYMNHDFDFRGVERTPRTDGMGGAGSALITGSAALTINPAGLASAGDFHGRGEFYVGSRSRFGSGSTQLEDELVFDTGVVGDIVPLGHSVDPRFSLSQGGLALSGRPFYDAEAPSGVRGFLGRTALGVAYHRFVEITNGTDAITNWLPSGGIEGFAAELKSAAQSREQGGVDAATFGAATRIGNDDGTWINAGVGVHLVNGRVRAEQVFTVAQLTQIVIELPGPFGDSFVEQKFTGLAMDIGAQAGLGGNLLTLGGSFRPAYTLEMEHGRFRVVNSGVSSGAATTVNIVDGRIAPYHLEMPSTIKVGGAVRLEPLVGVGDDATGVWGYVRRFFGRGTVAAELQRSKLSEATITQLEDQVQNPSIHDDYEDINEFLETLPGFVPLSPDIQLVSGNANLRDQESVHIGFETALTERPSWGLMLRLGWEQVPTSFSSLVLGPEQTSGGVVERPVLYSSNGKPKLEDVKGSAIALGFGLKTGPANFDLSVRRSSYDYVTWWGGAPPPSIYDPITGNYVIGFNTDPSFYAAEQVEFSETNLRLSASLGF